MKLPRKRGQTLNLEFRFKIQRLTPSAFHGFTLVEVLLSLGIMSVALLIVLGILTPFLDRTGEVVENTTVNRIADRIQAEVEQLSYNDVVNLLNLDTGLFASREGDRLILQNDPELENRLPEANRQYSIRLTRNEDISPIGRDATAGFIAFQIKIERLVHAPDGTILDNQQDQTLAIFNSAVLRSD